ncbi:hypothetical protein ACS5PK_19990 [Roseateles sp. DB2]|uniref:hypothetical protein n=1 Tax=Roseateles sp. DB2 TaxID=3453717 RepID=UPI003EEC0FE6
MKPTLIRTALSLCLAGFCLNSAHALPEPAMQAAVGQFVAATKGKSEATDPAIEQFQAMLKAEPGHPLLMSYLGAATTLKARDAWAPWKKMSHAEDGLAQIDKALGLLAPSHDEALYQGTAVSLQTRFVAANTFLGLPDMFNRGPRGRQLLEEIQASPLFAKAPAGFQGAVLMRAAREAEQAKQGERARTLFQQVVSRQLPQAAEAQAALKGGQ